MFLKVTEGDGMNGYFGLKTTDRGTYLIIKPPTEGGEPVRANELKDYLRSHGIELNPEAFNAVMLKGRETTANCLASATPLPPIDEEIIVYVNADKMHVTARFIPPSGGKKLTKQDIWNALSSQKVVAGINDSLVNKLTEKKRYCTDYEIASGTLPTSGRDAKINYHFNTDGSLRPTLKEDGSVDFFNLNNINHCKVGDVLAEIIPKEKGKDGVDVFGSVLPAREVSDVSFKYGLNISESEDGTKLISDVAGHVQLIEGTVFAADVYEIENVDTSTGNIEYTGNIQINGNVGDNYSVKASGTIEIRGTVGASTIEADGDIIIARGMYGQEKGRLKAKGNIIVKFIESATVEAGGFVEAESVLYSTIEAQNVHVEAKKGFVTGGKIRAKNAIKAKVIGSSMGSDTVLEVGIDAKARDRFTQLQKSVSEYKKAIKQIRPVLDTSLEKVKSGENVTQELLQSVKQLQQTLKIHQDALNEALTEMNVLADVINVSGQAHIDIDGTLFGGTRVTISGVSVVMKEAIKHSRLIKQGADIKITGF